VCVCVCVSFQFLSFKLSSGYLFSPHHVNQGLGCLGDIRLSSPRVPEKKGVFPVFLRFFSPRFLVREDPILLSSVDVYCCTYREDVGNTIPLCEG
jgi:hypothetical protein